MDGDLSSGRIETRTSTPAKPGTTKVKTSAVKTSDHYCRMITWIGWDSGFRGSGLRVGDHIVGADDRLYSQDDADSHRAAGAAHESEFWKLVNLGDGDETTLLILRNGTIVSITGTLTGSRAYRNEKGKRCYGEGGPAHGEKDGFNYAWRSWFETFKKKAQTVLCGWDYTVGYDTRRLQAQIAEFQPRVAYLTEKYPGQFADAVAADFAAMESILAGEGRDVADSDLEYRTLGERRAEQISAAAPAAFEAFRDEVTDKLLVEPFPAPNPFLEDIREHVGKIVELPEVTRRDVLFETKRSWYKFGRHQGVYLINRHDPLMQVLYAATDRYAEKVNPFFSGSRLRFFGVIDAIPALVSDVVRNTTVLGLTIRPIAALFTDEKDREKQFFLDMRPDSNPDGLFAGEKNLLTLKGLSLDAADGPGDVMRAYVDAIKRADNKTWRACYADWRVRQTFVDDDTWKYVDQTWITINDRYAASLWDKSRQRLLTDVYDAEVVSVSEPKIVYDAAQMPADILQPDDPKVVEEAQILMNHIGKFETGYRTFASSTLKRKWTLQRVDNGPWRIISAQGL